MRIHGTTQCRPIEAFRTEELPLLLAASRSRPSTRPSGPSPKVHRDFHVEVDKALYSVPHHAGRADTCGPGATRRRSSCTLKGELVKVHPRSPRAECSPTRPTCPAGKEIYATRDIERLGAAWRPITARPIGALRRRHLGHAVALDQDAPGLSPAGAGQEVGARPGRRGLPSGLEAEAVDVNLVSRMLERAREGRRARRPTRPGRDPGSLRPDPSEFASASEAGR